MHVYLPSLVLIARVVFLLEHRHTDSITDATARASAVVGVDNKALVDSKHLLQQTNISAIPVVSSIYMVEVVQSTRDLLGVILDSQLSPSDHIAAHRLIGCYFTSAAESLRQRTTTFLPLMKTTRESYRRTVSSLSSV